MQNPLKSLNKKLTKVVIALLLSLLAFGVDYTWNALTESQNIAGVDQERLIAKVTRVVDGDTLKVEVDGLERTFRLLSVDTPETVHPQRGVECFGTMASDEMKALLVGEMIRYEYDQAIGAQDRYKRDLVYVWRVDDNLFINEYLLQNGIAKFYKNRSKGRYDSAFMQLQNQAQHQQLGIWGSCPL